MWTAEPAAARAWRLGEHTELHHPCTPTHRALGRVGLLDDRNTHERVHKATCPSRAGSARPSHPTMPAATMRSTAAGAALSGTTRSVPPGRM